MTSNLERNLEKLFISLFIVFSCLFAFSICSEDGYNCEYKKDGFYSDDDFCHIYWRCNYGVAEEYECPAGTAWNHKESRCDWLDNVDCSRMDNADEKKADPDDDDDEKPAKPAKKAKKPKKKVKEEEEEDESYDDVPDKLAELKMKVILMSRSVVTNKPNNETDDDYDAYAYDTLCANLTVATSFREDPYVCNKYIRCNHGYAQKFKCSKHTAWDKDKKMCNWVETVDCGARELYSDEKLLGENDSDASLKNRTTLTTRTTTTSTTTSTTTTTTTKETTTDLKTTLFKTSKNVKDTTPEKSPTKADNIQPVTSAAPGGANGAQCQSFGSYFVADNSNCADYFMCNNGKESKMSCADKQLFNPDTSQCEDFQQVFCGSRPVNLADRNQCASKRDGIYPDMERGCKVFYQCINQQKSREANCPNALKFNSITGRCDNPANIMAPCGTYSTTSKGSFLQFASWSKFFVFGAICFVIS